MRYLGNPMLLWGDPWMFRMFRYKKREEKSEVSSDKLSGALPAKALQGRIYKTGPSVQRMRECLIPKYVYRLGRSTPLIAQGHLETQFFPYIFVVFPM